MHQPNSSAGPYSARQRYASLKVLESLIPELTNTTYDQGPFELICDDMGPANSMVRSKDDLTITGVIDLEWVYAGPAQLFASVPWWLLLDRQVNDEWDFDEDCEPPKATDRYFKCLDMFKRVLLEEEAKSTGNGNELSELVRLSEDSGAMWFHMLISSGFFDSTTFPCMQLRRHKGVEWWDELRHNHQDTDEVEEFVANKLNDLEAYDKVKDEVDHHQARMDREEIEIEDFMDTASARLKSDR